ncbi:hypothetical protein E8E14_007709 [Neopestalotiopsis sp. 37M]|nr:hypothetical protein E8E14_007709 [Neopestalotiopsis sp. 37M]
MPAKQNMWPSAPGLRHTVFFDFDIAISEIRKKLTPEFLKNKEWRDTLAKAANDCHREMVNHCVAGGNSLVFLQVTFLDALWGYLFGVAGGPSPWNMLLGNLDIYTKCSENDKLIHSHCLFSFSGVANLPEKNLIAAVRNGSYPRKETSNRNFSNSELFGPLPSGLRRKPSEQDTTGDPRKRTCDIKKEDVTAKRPRTSF